MRPERRRTPCCSSAARRASRWWPQLVTAELGRPVAVDAHPKHAVAIGAALAVAASDVPLAALPEPEPEVVVEPEPEPVVEPVRVAAPLVEPEREPEPEPEPARVAATVVEPEPARPELSQPVAVASARGRRGLMVGAGGAVVAAALVIGAVAAFGGGGGDGDGGDGGGEQVVDDDGDAPAGATACPPAGTPAVCIEDVTIDNGAILATFSTHDVTLSQPVGGHFEPNSLHAVFFFDQVEPSEGRVRGPTSPFGDPDADLAGLTTAEAPGSTSALCVLIQDDEGSIFAGTGNCAPLPGDI